MTFVSLSLQDKLKKSFMIRLKVRTENGTLIFSLVEDDSNYSIPTAFLKAVYSNYTVEKDEEKQV